MSLLPPWQIEGVFSASGEAGVFLAACGTVRLKVAVEFGEGPAEPTFTGGRRQGYAGKVDQRKGDKSNVVAEEGTVSGGYTSGFA